MIHSVLIFIGAGLGGLLRFWISEGFYYLLGRHFPYGTFFVNASGSFVMGLLFVVIFEKYHHIGNELRAFLMIGFLGGYTTFSSFSIETLSLFEKGAWISAGLNIVLSVTVCIGLAWFGVVSGRHL